MSTSIAARSNRYSPVFFFLVAAVIIGLFAAVLVIRSATAGKLDPKKNLVIKPVPAK